MVKQVAIVALDPRASAFYGNQVQELFGDYVKVRSYSVMEGTLSVVEAPKESLAFAVYPQKYHRPCLLLQLSYHHLLIICLLFIVTIFIREGKDRNA